MIESGVQIFTINDLLARIEANDQARNLSIYAGHITEQSKNAVVSMYLTRANGDTWPAKKIAEIKKLRGAYTALFKPGNEVMYFTSEPNGNYQYQYPNIDGGVNFQEITPHHGKELRQLIADILRLEKEILELKAVNAELNEELKYYQDGRNKFSGALEDVAMRLIPRFFPETKPFFSNNQQQPIQGTETMQDWQKIDLRGNDETAVENALIVLLSAFGDDKILSFARQIQSDPAKVDMLSKFI